MQPEPTPRAAFTGFMAASMLVLELLGIAHPFTGLIGGFLVVLLAVAYTNTLRSQHLLPYVNVERVAPAQSVEGSEVPVTLKVKNRGDPIPVLIVEDVVPKRLRPRGRTWFKVRMGKGESRTLTWYSRPAPGYHRIDEVVLAVTDPLGLFESWTTRLVRSSMSVAPLSLEEYSVGSRRRGRAEASWSLLTGKGLEFHHIREYEPGDDVRMIVWTATARMGRPMVRVGVMDTEFVMNLFFDLSGPSWVGTPGETAADWIMRIGLSLASAGAASGGIIQATLYQGEVWWTTGPLRGRDSVDVIRRSFSLQGPSRATLRMRIGSVIRRSIDSSLPDATSVFLLGPGVPLRSILEEVSSAPRPVVVLVSPTGGTLVEELVRRVERRVYEDHLGEYHSAGVRLLYSDSVGGVHGVLGEILSYAARSRVGGR